MERYLDNGGCRLWSIATGNEAGLPAILVNGGPGCDDYLWEVAAMIEPRCRVVRFEPRGCGRSDYDGNYDLDTMTADLDLVRDSYGFERTILIGHSFGPDLALAYTVRNPDRVAGVVAIAGGRIVNDRDWSEKYHRERDMRGERQPKTFVADPRVNEIGNRTYRDYIKRPALLSELAAIACPVRFIAAGADIRPNWPARQLAHLIPDAGYTEIADAEHCIWMSHPAELKQALDAALDDIDKDIDKTVVS